MRGIQRSCVEHQISKFLQAARWMPLTSGTQAGVSRYVLIEFKAYTHFACYFNLNRSTFSLISQGLPFSRVESVVRLAVTGERRRFWFLEYRAA